MSNASRPTWSAATGSATAATAQYSSRDLTAHAKLKLRQRGQGAPEEMRQRDLRAELLGDKQSVVDVEDDADIELSQASVSESEPSSDSEDEDDTEALLLELEKIKKEREAERLRLDSAKLERSIHGNPLLDPDRASFTVKRRWDDDVVFKNQNKLKTTTKKRFVNDTLRSDFHRKFMDRYIK